MRAAGAGTIVIVGAGLAGLRTAERLRRLGHGGPITLVGDEPHRPYDRPPLSKALLTQEEEPAAAMPLRTEPYADLGLDLRLGVHATALDTARRRGRRGRGGAPPGAGRACALLHRDSRARSPWAGVAGGAGR